jgi:hypothetical protein
MKSFPESSRQNQICGQSSNLSPEQLIDRGRKSIRISMKVGELFLPRRKSGVGPGEPKRALHQISLLE